MIASTLKASVGVSVVPRALKSSFIWFLPQVLIKHPLCAGVQGHRRRMVQEGKFDPGFVFKTDSGWIVLSVNLTVVP